MGKDEDGSDEHPTEDFHSEHFGSAMIDPLADLDPAMIDPLADFDPAMFDPLAGLDPAMIDPFAGLDPAILDQLGKIEIDHIEPSAEFNPREPESPAVSTQTAISSESSLTSEIQSFLNQAKAQLAYQRTREALSVVDKRIDNGVLLFLAASIINSLPRFLSTRQAAVAAAIGTALALYDYVSNRED